MMPLRHSCAAWRLSELLDGFAPVPPESDVAIGGVDLDSRRVVAGGLFIACRGAGILSVDSSRS